MMLMRGGGGGSVIGAAVVQILSSAHGQEEISSVLRSSQMDPRGNKPRCWMRAAGPLSKVRPWYP